MRRRTLLAATAALSAAPRLARAQDAWPSRPAKRRPLMRVEAVENVQG